jgi:hypothetical protein
VIPQHRRQGAARRPQRLICLLLMFLLVALALPAEAGKRRSRASRARAKARAAKKQKQRQAPAPTPEATPKGGATADGAPDTDDADPPAVDRRDRGKAREKVFDFTGFELAGSVRMPQLLYFLDRAEEELERASLERRSFVPEMMKSLDEENL